MLAEAAEDSVKPAKPSRTAPPRGLLGRLKGLAVFEAIDGRGERRAGANAPFAPRRSHGYIVVACVPGVLLLLLAGLLTWRPLTADPDALSTIPVAAPSQTGAERRLLGRITVLRDGLWEARLGPWSDIPAKGIARVGNPTVHAALATLLGDIASFGETIGDRAPPGVRRDRIFLGQVADLRRRLKAIDAQLGGGRSVTSYHLGLLALWAGDAEDAEPQFASVIDIARKTVPVDEAGRQRLDGIEASAAYGLGLSDAARGLWKKSVGDFDTALTAACRASAGGDTGLVLGPANLVALDTRAVRNDRLVALLRARNAGDDSVRRVVTSPSCTQLLAPSAHAPSGDADAETRALFGALALAGDPILAANLELRAALMGERDTVQRLLFEGGDTDAQTAQGLARAIVALDPPADAGGGVDRSALADLQHLSALKARLDTQLRNGTLAEPQSDPAWNWSDPTLFHDWKKNTGAALAASLLAAADDAVRDNPGLAAALYGTVIDNRSWMPLGAVTDAWWRINTGVSLGFVLWMLAIAAALTGAMLLLLRRLRATYRTTFESWHHDDRLAAPEG